MPEAFIHRFRWEGTESESLELRWNDPRKVSTPKKETLRTTPLQKEDIELLDLLDRTQAQISKEEDISEDLSELREEIIEKLRGEK